MTSTRLRKLVALMALAALPGGLHAAVSTATSNTTTGNYNASITPSPTNNLILQGTLTLAGSPVFSMPDTLNNSFGFSAGGINDGQSNLGGGSNGNATFFNASTYRSYALKVPGRWESMIYNRSLFCGDCCKCFIFSPGNVYGA